MMSAQGLGIRYAQHQSLPRRRQSRELPMIPVNTERARTPHHNADSSQSFLTAMTMTKTMGMTMTMGIIGLFVSTFSTSTLAVAEPGAPPAAQYNKHLTCAVYYRMVAGSFKRQGNGILAAPALDQMNLMITRTKALGAALGHTEADYLSDWSDTLGVMTDQMNRNYDNIRQLKTRYQNRCKALND
jgi:hypothetical protein